MRLLYNPRVRRLAVVVALVALTAAAFVIMRRPRVAAPDPGVPLTLAEDRAARVRGLRYDARFVIPDTLRQAVVGRVAASFVLDDATRPLAFDFAEPGGSLLALNANGQLLSPQVVNGHILIDPAVLRAGDNTISFSFLAGDEALNRTSDFLYTLFVPARASIAMPCFDQPDLKGRWTITLEIPAGWAAVSNSAPAKDTTAGDRRTVTFAETAPLPTYLVAFAAGRFTAETGTRDGRVFHVFHRETDREKVARNLPAILDLHAHALAWLEDYTGIPYPFDKLDVVLIPSFQFGGMEHAGAIFYNANSVLLDASATESQTLARANTIAHETSHMWFGDLVTMRWFNDVWMKEVFANFMAAKIVNPAFPDVNHDLRFLLQNYPEAYDVDRTAGSNPIRQDLDNLDHAGSLYGAIIYQKAPIVMRQLERLIGDEAFHAGVRDYLRGHLFRNADWPSLLRALGAHTDEDLAAWNHAWIDEAGRPTIATALDLDARGAIRRLAFEQRDPSGRGLTWPQALTVVIGTAAGVRRFDVKLEGPSVVVAGAAGVAKPLWVLPVGDGLGYGDFELDPATLDFLASSLARIEDPLTRGSALVALWEAMLDGRVAPSRVLAELESILPNEPDPLILEQMLGDARTIFWRFTPAARRMDAAVTLEPILRAGLDRAATGTAKGAWWRALQSVAMTPATVGWLAQVWRREVSIAGLPLSESDEADLAAALAVRDVAGAKAVLDGQLQRFTNADRRARFSFLMPALSSDATVRQQFFEGLKSPANRTRESWVVDAMTYLNHPLRADASRRDIRPALDLVREIQRTGDIFFPTRWTDAALGGYQTADAAADVQGFLDALPTDYPPRLRWIVLASADPLFRAARLLQHP